MVETAIPPGPTSSPLYQKLRWILEPIKFLDECHHQYGDAFTVQLGKSARPMVMFSHPEVIGQIFKAPPHQFDAGRANQILKPLLGPRSLELLDGRRHDRHRKILLPPFQGSRMQLFSDIIQRQTQTLVQQWQPGQRFNARNCLQNLSFGIMSEILFGPGDAEVQTQIYHCFDRLINIASESPLTSIRLFFPNLQKDWLPFVKWQEFRQMRARLDQLLFDMIQIRRSRAISDQATDLLSSLMQAHDEQERPLSDQDIHSELMTLLFAGHETIASAAAWTLYRIFSFPEGLQKIQQELANLPKGTAISDISSLPYLNALILETLRIYPIGLILFPRIVKKAMSLGGYSLPKGTVLTGSIYLTHQRSDLYPHPQVFQPERFLTKKYAPHEYYPFGGGNRRCLGSAFAPFMIKLIMAEILQHWTLEICDRTPIRPHRRGVTTAPKGGVNVKVVAPILRSQNTSPSLVLQSL